MADGRGIPLDPRFQMGKCDVTRNDDDVPDVKPPTNDIELARLNRTEKELKAAVAALGEIRSGLQARIEDVWGHDFTDATHVTAIGIRLCKRCSITWLSQAAEWKCPGTPQADGDRG